MSKKAITPYIKSKDQLGDAFTKDLSSYLVKGTSIFFSRGIDICTLFFFEQNTSFFLSLNMVSKTPFGGRSCIQILPHIYFPNLSRPIGG